MTYIPIKKDLTEGTETCEFCGKRLKSLTAFNLKNTETNDIVFAGETCAKRNIPLDYNIKLIPDFTKFTLSVNENEKLSISDTRKSNKSELTEEEKDYKKAIEYIELRENKLQENFETSYPILKEYYNEYLLNNILGANEIKHILNIENKAPEKLKLNNLQKCYNYSFWINVAINKLDKEANVFLISIQKYLEKNFKISEKQKIGVNKWLKNLNGIPQIK